MASPASILDRKFHYVDDIPFEITNGSLLFELRPKKLDIVFSPNYRFSFTHSFYMAEDAVSLTNKTRYESLSARIRA